MSGFTLKNWKMNINLRMS